MTRPGLFDELKRRKVVRVGIVYAASAFVALQAADLILPRLGVPEWGMSLIVVLALIGLPVALALAWAFDITPEGVRRTEPQSGPDTSPEEAEPLPALLGRRSALVSGALVVLGIGLGAGWFLKPAAVAAPDLFAPAAPAIADKSIAVLPFADLSEAGDQQWFTDGLTEEILTSLSRLPELRVIGRNSSFLFTAGAADDRSIAETLGVAHLVKGSVRRVGGQLRVTAQLLRAADGVQLWSAAYDRSAADILDVQRDVAEKVAGALDILLDDERRERMFASGTRSVEAFEAYLRGREILIAVHAGDAQRTLADANLWFERALALDPAFGRPALLHADRYSHLVMDGPDGPWVGPHDLSLEEAIGRLRGSFDQAARTAADPYDRTVAEINRELFAPRWHRLPGLIEQLRRHAATGQPSLDDPWSPVVLIVAGEVDVARALAERVLRAEPLEPIAWSAAATAALAAGDLEAARSLLAGARDAGVEHPFLRSDERIVLMAAGDRDGLLARLDGSTGALAAALRGDVPAALERAAAIEAASDWPPISLLLVYHQLGDRDRSRDLVRRIDALPAGPAILAREVWNNGRNLTFDLADAPNFSARLTEAGVDPRSFRVMPRLSPAPSASLHGHPPFANLMRAVR